MNGYNQEPVAIVGFSCRLPGGNYSPQKLWDFLERGDVAPNDVPQTRFNIHGHHDGSQKPGTIRPKGGMFLREVDLADFDAAFFEISGTDAVAMDPNQRQMLEVVYEALENAGIPLEKLDGAPVGCFVGSYACDYGDMQSRDAEDRPPNCSVGVGRAVMSNRLSYFLNTKGPSMTVDTACSAALVALDLACRSLHLGESNSAIVATSNLYLNPDHAMDPILGQAHSPTALCHTFDADADGYCKAEAVSCFVLKRLSDAIRSRDPIRAVIRGTSSNSNGRTGGIASPSAEGQAAAIRAAYVNAGIKNFDETAYLECHGTGTPVGDPIEIRGIASVFAQSRAADRPLRIGSIKSNIGHSEPASGFSGIMKCVLAMENGIIPGNPTFIKPNPKIDFIGSKVKVSRTATPWPDEGYAVRRASVNAFGFGGSNAHAIIEQPTVGARSNHISSYRAPDDHTFDEEEDVERPQTIVLSANDATSLKANIKALVNHLINPRVKVNLSDLAYTLSERRTRLWHRAFVTTHTIELEENQFVVAKRRTNLPKISLVFTGQGAQWPEMGKDLLRFFPWTRSILEELDQVLQAQPQPPKWSLVTELTEARTAEHMRQPEFSQPLVTALQLCIVAILESWGVRAGSVVGHSSGEIAAAYAAGFLDRAGSIKTAFYRGRAALNQHNEAESDVGMLAVGLSAEDVDPFLEKYVGSVWIACFNSDVALTISGRKPALEALAEDLKTAGHFARLLMVDLAYHSVLMRAIGEEYDTLLNTDSKFKPLSGRHDVTMFSSVTGSKKDTPADALYWKTNMVSPVRFSAALKELITKDSPDILIEVGPSGSLAGPISQILKALPLGSDVSYAAAWSRGPNAGKSLFDVAGRLFVAGAPIDMTLVNEYDLDTVHTYVDLPNYSWNHSTKYWYENDASKDWRYKKFITHDLLGAKIPSTSWEAPSWRKILKLADVPWLGDHRIGPDVLIPGAGLCTLALEAMYQKYSVLNPDEGITSPNELAYRFRNVNFKRALVIDENKTTTILVTLFKASGSKDWHEFRICTKAGDVIYEHSYGLIRVQDPIGDETSISGSDLESLKHPQNPKLWYKLQEEVGISFGPAFQNLKAIESVNGSRKCRTILSLEPPRSKWNPQSYYPLHPAIFDTCFQSVIPAMVAGDRSSVKDLVVPSVIDDLVVNKVPKDLKEGLSIAESFWTGRGRKDAAKSWYSNIGIHDSRSGKVLMRINGLNCARLDVEEKQDPHVFQAITWKPDVSFMTESQLACLPTSSHASNELDYVIDLVVHKKPTLKVLEVDLNGKETSSLWFEGGDVSSRAVYSRYDFATVDAGDLVRVRQAFGFKRNSYFHLMALSEEFLGLSISEPTYDLAIVKAPAQTDINVEDVIEKVKPLLSSDAFTVVVSHRPHTNTKLEIPGIDTPSPDTPGTPSENSLETSDNTPPTSFSSTPLDVKLIMERFKINGTFDIIKEVANSLGSSPAYVCSNTTGAKTGGHWHLTVAKFDESTPALDRSIQSTLQESRWTINTSSVEELAAEPSQDSSSIVMVVEDLFRPVLTQISTTQWEALKRLVATGNQLLWVTKGGQTTRVTDPDNAMVQGLFRVIRREDPMAKLVILDVESATSPTSAWAIHQVLNKLKEQTHYETEYAERDGVLLIQRVVPDVPINDFKTAASGKGLELVTKSFHETIPQVRLHAEKVGTLQSLVWTETAIDEVPIMPGMVEIEVMAVGVNFKDVVTTMGIIPENEHTTGSECAGYVKRFAPGVTKFKIGDRVACMSIGTYANRMQCPAERARIIPETLTFEEAATVPVTYLTAYYGLYHLGNLKEGQSVLIHSAAGGVGIAAIQLCQYKKCDIFVTVGTDDKREFLAKNFDIPQNRMFNSRNTKFAEDIRRETNGRGIDVILNSLTGELLDESWRLTADGGIMVEIGKRDIIDRNTLSMEPFARNCSFRAVDLSYTREITHELVGRLLGEVFDLIKAGHIGPIRPMSVYPFDKVVEALTFMRRGQHIGKIVISSGIEGDVQLPIRPAIRQLELKTNASYLIVGGLKGLCGSVAIHLARHGARNIISMSRSGIRDEASARVIAHCAEWNCNIVEAKGDVGDFDFVRSVFNSATPKIAGVIQGAMVLRDKPYEIMTADEYHTAIHAKVAGTWNLHNACLQENMRPLDFFTALSSISGVIGNKGQANYAAANTFLDAFASYRKGLGWNANTIDLGAIEDVGYVAEEGGSLEARFDKRQWTRINEGMLRKIVDLSILQQECNPINPSTTTQLITGIAYPLTRDGSDLADEPRFRYLFKSDGADSETVDVDGGGDQANQAIKAFRLMHSSGADAVTLSRAAVGLLGTQVAKLLRLETEIEPGKPLMAYGIDSLSAVELRGWVRQNLNSELSTFDINNASSLVALCEKLVSKLLPPTSG